MVPESVTVRVPGSTSNLGSGFDTLGLALRIHNTITVTSESRPGIRLEDLPDPADHEGAKRLIGEAARAFARKTGRHLPGFRVGLSGAVPAGRGLGSSVTLRLGIVAGLDVLLDTRLTRPELLDLVTRLEGHPDNVSPALFGGFTVSGLVGGEVRCHAVRVSPKLRFVVLIPPFAVATDRARSFMPEDYSRRDALHGLNRAALITAAFARADYAALAGIFDDRIHQPFRRKLIPPLTRIIRAAESAGAIGGFLSGSGSSIIAVALDRPEPIARAMHRLMPKARLEILRADNHGARRHPKPI